MTVRGRFFNYTFAPQSGALLTAFKVKL